jgi:phosphate uptake regulator
MSEHRKLQKVGYSTLTVSIPRDFAKRAGLKPGDTVILKEESDGTLIIIPRTSTDRTNRITIALGGIDEALLQKVVKGCYALGFDRIEIAPREKADRNLLERCKDIVKRLRGLEIVEAETKIIIQSFIDPTKFPVDGLIKRLQLLVSQSLQNVNSSLEKVKIDTVKLNEVKRISYEVEDLYWLIIRQLLVALNKRELSGEIGIESPLHAAGDRVVAKTLVEIANVTSEIAEEIIRMRERRLELEKEMFDKLRLLAKNAGNVFDKTVEAFLTNKISLIREAIKDAEKVLEFGGGLGKFENYEQSSIRIIASYFISLVKYCNIINEISLHRFLRKSGDNVSIQL